MLRASGVLDMLTGFLSPLTSTLGIPSEIMPLALLRPVSGSGSLAIVNDIFGNYGTDSLVGRIASVMMGSTETTLYTIAVYTSSVKIKNTRVILIAALTADITGILVSLLVCRAIF